MSEPLSGSRRLVRGRRHLEEAKKSAPHSSLPDDEALRLLDAANQKVAKSPGVPQGSLGAGNHDAMRSLAQALGNRRFGQLAREGQVDENALDEEIEPDRLTDGSFDKARSASPILQDTGLASGIVSAAPAGGGTALVQREARGSDIAVRLAFSETDMARYQVTGETMRDVEAELPAVLGQFDHSCESSWSTQETEDSEWVVTTVTLPVQYYYTMPQWTRLSEQPERVQEAWGRFYSDLFAHEREHLSVSRRYYNELETALEALPPEERTEARVQQEIDTSVENQNENHASHAGFVTPSVLVFADYIPEPEEDSETEEEGIEGSLEDEE